MTNPGKERQHGWRGQSHGSSMLCRHPRWDTELSKNRGEDAAAIDKSLARNFSWED